MRTSLLVVATLTLALTLPGNAIAAVERCGLTADPVADLEIVMMEGDGCRYVKIANGAQALAGLALDTVREDIRTKKAQVDEMVERLNERVDCVRGTPAGDISLNELRECLGA